MYNIIFYLLKKIDAEKAHNFILSSTNNKIMYYIMSNLYHKLYYNNIILAAGFDKNGDYLRVWESLGLNTVEIGTVTPIAQSGNSKPRLFRLLSDYAIINRMGFNNQGINKIKYNIENYNGNLNIGINIGKNKFTDNLDSNKDYLKCFSELYEYGKYFVINVSSPNTPGLRQLQQKDLLYSLLSEIQNVNNKMPFIKQILLKIAPDLHISDLNDIIEVVKKVNLYGIIATNTTLDRSNLKTDKVTLEKIGPGGLSGLPLRDKSTSIVRYVAQAGVKVWGVGGILSGADALEKIDAGAEAVQLYTGLVYRGPVLFSEINQAFIERGLERKSLF